MTIADGVMGAEHEGLADPTAIKAAARTGTPQPIQSPQLTLSAFMDLAFVNALQRFNDRTPARAEEARRRIGHAAELGAPGVVLCPAHQPGDERSATGTTVRILAPSSRSA